MCTNRADDPEVGRQPERLIGVEQADRFIAVLQQEVEFAEDFGDVAAVDLVDNQYVDDVRIMRRGLGQLLQRPLAQLEAAAGRGPIAFDEILVGVAGVKLHQPHLASFIILIRIAAEEACQAPRHERLPGARRPVEDHLPLVIQQPPYLLQVAGVQ